MNVKGVSADLCIMCTKFASMIYYVFLCAKSPKRRASGRSSQRRTAHGNFCACQKEADALRHFQGRIFRPSANFSFSKQKGIAPLGGAAYAFIVSEILLKKSASDCYGTFRIIAFYPESTIILIGISNDLESFATPRADFLKITLEICIRV